MDKRDIKSLNFEELNTAILEMGEKSFRAKQIYDWLHVKLVRSFDEMTNLSVDLRNKLKDNFVLTALEIVRVQESAIDGTRKYLFKLDCEHMDWCDTILFLFDGRVPDEGACFELGYCYARGKRCIGYKTDARSFIDGFDNVMLHGAPETILRSEQELREFFGQK